MVNMKSSLSFARIVKLLVNDLSGMETAKKFRGNFVDVILVFYGVTYNACFRTFLWKKELYSVEAFKIYQIR